MCPNCGSNIYRGGLCVCCWCEPGQRVQPHFMDGDVWERGLRYGWHLTDLQIRKRLGKV